MEPQNEKIKSIISEIFPSEEMASYLSRCPYGDHLHFRRRRPIFDDVPVFDDAPPEKLPLRRRDMVASIVNAPVSLERKRELFLRLAEDEESPYFSILADMLGQAIREMTPQPGEFLYMFAYYYKEDGCCGEDSEPIGAFLSWEDVWEAIRECMEDEWDDIGSMTWFWVEKWTPDGNGKLKNSYNYETVGGEVCYCSSDEFPDFEDVWMDDFGRNVAVEPYLPVPFHAGDILTVDCRPYVPVSHVVILTIGDNRDCCSVQALYHKCDDIWRMGAVRHGSIFPNPHPGLSPLYRLASFHGQLPEEERILEKVSKFVDGSETRGAALWEYIHDNSGTEAEILSYIEAGGRP